MGRLHVNLADRLECPLFIAGLRHASGCILTKEGRLHVDVELKTAAIRTHAALATWTIAREFLDGCAMLGRVVLVFGAFGDGTLDRLDRFLMVLYLSNLSHSLHLF